MVKIFILFTLLIPLSVSAGVSDSKKTSPEGVSPTPIYEAYLECIEDMVFEQALTIEEADNVCGNLLDLTLFGMHRETLEILLSDIAETFSRPEYQISVVLNVTLASAIWMVARSPALKQKVLQRLNLSLAFIPPEFIEGFFPQPANKIYIPQNKNYSLDRIKNILALPQSEQLKILESDKNLLRYFLIVHDSIATQKFLISVKNGTAI